MNTTRVRAALRRKRQEKRLEILRSQGVDTSNWRDKPALKHFVIFAIPVVGIRS